MDNANKAISMGVSALLFVFALSIAIASYSNILTFIDSILTQSEIHEHDVEGLQSSQIITFDINDMA
jgi:hypothetical protein